MRPPTNSLSLELHLPKKRTHLWWYAGPGPWVPPRGGSLLPETRHHLEVWGKLGISGGPRSIWPLAFYPARRNPLGYSLATEQRAVIPTSTTATTTAQTWTNPFHRCTRKRPRWVSERTRVNIALLRLLLVRRDMARFFSPFFWKNTRTEAVPTLRPDRPPLVFPPAGSWSILPPAARRAYPLGSRPGRSWVVPIHTHKLLR